MIRRALLFTMMVILGVSPALALRQVCDLNGNCHPPVPGPDWGEDPQHRQVPSGSPGGLPVFNPVSEEPFRNVDMGPLGVSSSPKFVPHLMDKLVE